MKYPFGFANYPKKFKGYVVSPDKICLQYEDTQIKLRKLEGDFKKLGKIGKDSERFVPVVPLGTDIEVLAVGHQMPVLQEMQLKLCEAYKEYYKLHKDTYKEKYGEDFTEFLGRIQKLLSEIS
jgi:hypothetical protein